MFLQVKGEAEAFAIEAKARAEAEQMAKKADAWKDYQDAAMVDMVLETLPKVKIKRTLETFIHLRQKAHGCFKIKCCIQTLVILHQHSGNLAVKKMSFVHQIAAEIAQPLAQAKKVTMVSSGKGEVGATKLTSEVMLIMEKLPLMVENLTGINISKVSSCIKLTLDMIRQTSSIQFIMKRKFLR